MKGALVFALTLALTLPAVSKEKGTYVAKKESYVKKKKSKKKHYLRYPAKVNPKGEDLKIKEMLKDIYE